MAGRQAALVDAVDHLLNRGAVVLGDVRLSLADVDLICLKLNVVLSSVETLEDAASRKPVSASTDGSVEPGGTQGRRAATFPATESAPQRASEPVAGPVRSGLSSEPAGAPLRPPPVATERPDRGLAQLVLTLVDLIRELMERQALRRMEKGNLTEEQIERMGLSLMELEAKVAEVCDLFGLNREDLNLELGPLGRLF